MALLPLYNFQLRSFHSNIYFMRTYSKQDKNHTSMNESLLLLLCYAIKSTEKKKKIK